MDYDIIAIIYNPNSTGNSGSLAKDLKRRLAEKLPDQTITLHATQHPGHAEELAYTTAQSHPQALIISSSGDGGYHEVVNGVMHAKDEGANPTVGLLPGGNANDHYTSLHQDTDIVERIIKAASIPIDVLHISATSDDTKHYERYAHSYIGVGITPWTGQALTKAKLNPFNQAYISLKSIVTFEFVSLRLDKTVHEYSNVIFSNVDTMAKFLHFSQHAKIDDGKFEVTIFPKINKWKLIAQFLKLSAAQSHTNKRTNEYEFATVTKTFIQLDGEVTTLAPDSTVTIKSIHKALRCIV